MSMYLGSKEVAVVITKNSMKAYLDAGGKCSGKAVSFEGCWKASDWENVTDMSYMFSGCQELTSIPAMNTIKATDMSYMCYYCYDLTSVSAMDTSNVTNMSYMFSGCNNLAVIPQMDTSNVTNMRQMFYNCSNLAVIPQMDTSKVTDMNHTFYNCSNLAVIYATDTSNVTDMNDTFTGCSNLESIHMTGMKVSFDITSSTKFTREALVEILNNLTAVTTSPTLTMGSMNLAKLTDEDKAIATGKGWRLA